MYALSLASFKKTVLQNPITFESYSLNKSTNRAVDNAVVVVAVWFAPLVTVGVRVGGVAAFVAVRSFHVLRVPERGRCHDRVRIVESRFHVQFDPVSKEDDRFERLGFGSTVAVVLRRVRRFGPGVRRRCGRTRSWIRVHRLPQRPHAGRRVHPGARSHFMRGQRGGPVSRDQPQLPRRLRTLLLRALGAHRRVLVLGRQQQHGIPQAVPVWPRGTVTASLIAAIDSATFTTATTNVPGPRHGVRAEQ